jgi:hypothetical protein
MKIFKIIIPCLVVTIVFVLISFGYYKKNDAQIEQPKEIINVEDDNVSSIEKEDAVDEIDSAPTKEKEEETKKPIIKEKQETNKDKNTTNEIIDTSPPIEEVKEETPLVEEVIEDKPMIDDNIPDQNDMFYSIHRGRYDYSSYSDCVKAGERIALANEVDVLYFNCLEVYSTTNKLLGIYLDILCQSGNCDKYK